MLVAMTKARSKIWIALYNTSPAGLYYYFDPILGTILGINDQEN